MIHIIKPKISIPTIVEPTGVPARIDTTIPIAADKTEKIDENITTLLNFLNNFIADKAGKIISADVRSEPTKFIARTIIMAMTIAITIL